jgi:hypothetical protein
LREIAKEFNLSLEMIEIEIADLIVNSKIQAKIDSHSKVKIFTSISQIPLVVVFKEG